MQLTDKIFKGLYRRGVMLEQMKEPALSRTVKQMEPAEPCENPRDIDALSPEEILRAAEEADIVDETDGRPLAEKLREAGAEVLGIVSIFTYGMKKGLERLAAAKVRNVSLTNFDVIAQVAAEQKYIKPEDVARLLQFRNDPSDESWIGGTN